MAVALDCLIKHACRNPIAFYKNHQRLLIETGLERAKASISFLYPGCVGRGMRCSRVGRFVCCDMRRR